MALLNRPYQHLYDHRWRKHSKLFLSRNPLCKYCLQVGKTTRSEVTDHIIPHKGDSGLFWDYKNHQPLCKACHDGVKALEESRGFAVGCGEDGFPVDPNHKWNKGE